MKRLSFCLIFRFVIKLFLRDYVLRNPFKNNQVSEVIKTFELLKRKKQPATNTILRSDRVSTALGIVGLSIEHFGIRQDTICLKNKIIRYKISKIRAPLHTLNLLILRQCRDSIPTQTARARVAQSERYFVMRPK